jgi:hypothetical protein
MNHSLVRSQYVLGQASPLSFPGNSENTNGHTMIFNFDNVVTPLILPKNHILLKTISYRKGMEMRRYLHGVTSSIPREVGEHLPLGE